MKCQCRSTVKFKIRRLSTSSPPMTVVVQSYQNLAAAAAELAKDAARSQPPASKPESASKQPAAAAAVAAAASPIRPSAPSPVRSEPRSSLLPFAAARPSSGPSLPKTPTPAGTGSKRASVSTPKFPPVNPLVHVMVSELPMPGASPPGQQQRGGGTPAAGGFGAVSAASALRPSTSNPITHEMGFAETSGRPGSTAFRPPARDSHRPASSSPWKQEPLVGGEGFDRVSAGPGDGGSERAQVLFVDDRGRAPERSSHPTGGGGSSSRGGRDTIDPVSFALANPDRVRLTMWPPSSPYHTNDVEQDNFAIRCALGS